MCVYILCILSEHDFPVFCTRCRTEYGNQKGMSTTNCLADVYHDLVAEAETSDAIGTLSAIYYKIAKPNLLSMVTVRVCRYLGNRSFLGGSRV